MMRRQGEILEKKRLNPDAFKVPAPAAQKSFEAGFAVAALPGRLGYRRVAGLPAVPGKKAAKFESRTVGCRFVFAPRIL